MPPSPDGLVVVNVVGDVGVGRWKDNPNVKKVRGRAMSETNRKRVRMRERGG